MEAIYAFFMDKAGMGATAAHITVAAIMATLMFTVMALCAIVFTWMERKVAAFLQSRWGPMRTGRWQGWAQAVADMLKILGKEDIIPAEADKGLFQFAPILVLLGSLLAWAAIPCPPRRTRACSSSRRSWCCWVRCWPGRRSPGRRASSRRTWTWACSTSSPSAAWSSSAS